MTPRQKAAEPSSVWSRPIASEPVRFVILAPLIALALWFVPLPEAVVDQFYSRDMYASMQRGVTSLTNVLPIAIMDLWILIAIVLVILRIGKLFGTIRQYGLLEALSESVRRIIRAAAVLAIVFMWMWGFNYRRIPLDNVLQDVVRRPSIEVYQAAAIDGNSLARRLRPAVLQAPELDIEQVAEELREPFNEALKRLDRGSFEVPGRPKLSFLLTPFFRWSGVTGMINPLGLESIVHAELLPAERPFVLAHEWAHLAGHADEAEASAVGFLACMKGKPAAAYSASLYLIMEASAALPPEQRKTLMARLDADVRTDLEAIAARMHKESPTFSNLTGQVYDRYLKVNRVEDGTGSYRRALALILSPKIKEAFNQYKR
jgi:hypothetical protein